MPNLSVGLRIRITCESCNHKFELDGFQILGSKPVKCPNCPKRWNSYSIRKQAKKNCNDMLSFTNVVKPSNL